jgi:hypothetical protein
MNPGTKTITPTPHSHDDCAGLRRARAVAVLRAAAVAITEVRHIWGSGFRLKS